MIVIYTIIALFIYAFLTYCYTDDPSVDNSLLAVSISTIKLLSVRD